MVENMAAKVRSEVVISAASEPWEVTLGEDSTE